MIQIRINYTLLACIVGQDVPLFKSSARGRLDVKALEGSTVQKGGGREVHIRRGS